MSQSTRIFPSPLSAPAEIMPATPVRRTTLSPSPDLSGPIKASSSQSDKKFLSPTLFPPSDMTPPPTTQIPGAPLRQSLSRSISPSLAAPAGLTNALREAYGVSENLPTNEDIDNANETQLRIIAKDLLAMAQEDRMSALHFKLQNSLVSFASKEAVKRAQVERQLAKSEVEILQRIGSLDPSRPIPAHSPVSTDDYVASLQRAGELEGANALLDRRLRHAKRLIDDVTTRSVDLAEQNVMLKKRIEDNRIHFNQIYNYGSLSPNMQNEYRSLCRGEPTDGLAALLFADKFTNRLHKPHDSFDSRGSVPVTPKQTRSVRQEHPYMTPAQVSHEQQYDSDSTVSLSARNSEDEAIQSRPSIRSGPPRTSTLLQSKLFGHVMKPGVERNHSTKRKASFGESSTPKKNKTNGPVGLGIEA
ncbi:hypothetical protein N7495_007100 [Penicillium taxi]|uniref:uncharacterized protein n=1 Tax=Penicillium taxi TaxID=168475 RepID=UPI002545B480|nr:uncharacterized protein N7495_007100 [Penicillium taxi]KAJ5895409.1 hypothetical protein N7495_007100 [Penicillium taxi]